VEDPQRLVVEARQHHEPVGLREARDAALQERDVHARLRVEQQRVVLPGSLRLADLDGHTLAGQPLAVAHRVLVIEAGRPARGEHDPPRRHRFEQLERDPQRAGDGDPEQQHRPQEVAA